MNYRFTLSESEKSKIIGLYKEQVLPTEKQGVYKWIEDNDVTFRTIIYPNPYNLEGDLTLGIESSVDFPMMSQNNDPNNPPYHYYREKFINEIDFIDVVSQKGERVFTEELTSENLQPDGENKVIIKFKSGDGLIENLRPGTYYVNFGTSEKWDVLSPKYKIKSGILKVE